MKTRRRLLAMLLAAAVTGSMCAVPALAEEDYSLSGVTFENVTIRVATRAGGDAADSQYYQQKVEEFNALDNGITVEMTNISTETDYKDRLSTDFASGDAPNIFLEYGGANLVDYLDAGYLLNLEPYLEADPEWYAGFKENGWSTCLFEDYGYEGIYGVPSETYQILLYYNKDILEQNGLEPPTTWEELMDACAVLKEAGIDPFAVGEKDIWRFGHLHTILSLKSYGADVAQKLGNGEMTYDSEEMIAIYQMIKDMVDNGYLGSNLLSTDKGMEDSLFEEGKAAFKYDGSWFPASLEQSGSDLYTEQKIGVVSFPVVNEEYPHVEMGGTTDAYYVSTLNATEEQIQASVVFLKYLASVEYIEGLIQVHSNTYAYNVEAASDNYLLNEVIDLMGEAEELRGDLQNYDTRSMAMNTVRTSLQELAMGSSPEEVGKLIEDTLAEYE
ncbi:MAG: extracellular solute-binding protein [Eubacteriales bacterium]|nr:extracellular solute-binding protein [Eubacteriales bacterium]